MNEEVDRVVVVYNSFVSPLVQHVTVAELLPVPLEALGRAEDADAQEPTAPLLEGGLPLDFFFEPEPREIKRLSQTPENTDAHLIFPRREARHGKN